MKHIWHRPLRVLLFALTLAVAACDDASTLTVQARAALSDSTGLAGLVLRIDGQEIRADDFRSEATGTPQVLLDVPNEGRLEVRVELQESGETVAQGLVAWDLRPDYEWTLDVFRQANDPSEGCLGCAGTERLSIASVAQTEPGEALWFNWGGKPKGSDIVF